MTVENHWKQIKHQYLHNLNRPRLDLTVFILCTEVTPNFVRRAKALAEVLPHGGRMPPFTSFQQGFKKAWKLLSNRDIGHTNYLTDVNLWLCNCGSQELHTYHLCKHLVQAVTHPLPPHFFHEIHQRRTVPLYRHPHLQANIHAVVLEDGSISDGDDRPECFGKESYLVDGNWERVSWVKDSLKRKPSVISISSNGEHLDIGRSTPGLDPLSDDDSEEVCNAHTFVSRMFT
jgi:hypothetical protein